MVVVLGGNTSVLSWWLGAGLPSVELVAGSWSTFPRHQRHASSSTARRRQRQSLENTRFR